jgi:uncharacterized protein (TIGR00290 family)
MNNLAVFNWSGGKDSTLALHYILLENKYKIHCLLTTVNDSYNRVAMHGVRASLLEQQASMLQLPLRQVKLPEMPDMETYENVISAHFEDLKSAGVTNSIYGDIFLADLREYREKQMAAMGMTAVFPLWKRGSLELVKEFILLGYQTIVVCAKDGLQEFCGRVIDQSFLDDLPPDIDPCGENGEFHTFVFDGPIFEKPIDFELGELVYKELPRNSSSDESIGFWYIDLIPN